MIPENVIRSAHAEGLVTGNSTRFRPILFGDRTVGFYYPRKYRDGKRIGPIYVLPQYRRKGLTRSLYFSIPGKLYAFVREGNLASQELHLKSGFVPLKPYRGGWWYVRP